MVGRETVLYLVSSPWHNAWLRVQERKKGKKVDLREEKAKREDKKGKDEVQRKERRKWPCQPQFSLDQGAQSGSRDAGQ